MKLHNIGEVIMQLKEEDLNLEVFWAPDLKKSTSNLIPITMAIVINSHTGEKKIVFTPENNITQRVIPTKIS